MVNRLITQSLDSLFASSPIGSLDKALTYNARGINALQTQNLTNPSQDHQGYLFMTRPQLNMQKDNIRNFAPLYALLNDDPNGIPLAIKSLLDPRIGAGYTFPVGNGTTRSVAPITSNIIDNNLAFIPFVTNNVLNSTGWADKTLPTSSTEKGLHKQSYVLVDGISRSYEEWDLTINLLNTKGDMAVAFFSAWMDYISLVKEGKFAPYFDYLINNRIDYQTRIYRLVVDKNKEYVTKILACGAAIPTSSPFGMFGDFDRSVNFSEQTKELSFRFRCMGQFQNDGRLIDSFNKTVNAFNPGMWDDQRETAMTRVPRHYLTRFRDKLYPRIDPHSLRLEWWTYNGNWNRVMNEGISDEFQGMADYEAEPAMIDNDEIGSWV